MHGIGGCSIEDAKQKLTHAEVMIWSAYKKRRGSLFLGNRLESSFATLLAMFSAAHGGKATERDFMPHADSLPEDF